MEKILSQDEINALLCNRSGPQSKPAQQPLSERVVPYVFGQSSGITSQQLSAINLLHETFARNLTQRLSAHLRAMFEVTLVSAEQLPFTEFLQQMAERSYLASMHVQPLSATALFDLDLALAFPIIDLLLGGEGKSESSKRDLTEIEDLTIQTVTQIIFEELQGAWENQVSVKFDFEQRQQPAQVIRLLPANERMLAISFEVQLPNQRGTFTFAFPAAVSGALMRKISEQSLVRKRHIAPDFIAARRRQLEDCRFAMEMQLPGVSLPASDLARIKVGETLVLQHRIDQPITLTVANQNTFTAYPVRARNKRAALIEAHVPLTAPPAKELV